MYLERIRTFINAYSNDQMQGFIEKFRKRLIYKYKKKNKSKSDAEKTLGIFLNGSDEITAQNFEAILLTIDETTTIDGSIEVLNGNVPKVANNWRDILALSAKDYVPPKMVSEHLYDEVILTEIKSLFKNAIEFCSHPDRETFGIRLHDFNRFLQIKNDGKKRRF